MTIQRETLWQSGDSDDFEAVFDRCSRAVYNHAFRLTGSWSVAEDVTQAVFLTAWRRRAEVRLVDGSPLPWLLVTASHHVRSEQRALTRWRNRLFRAPADEILADPADDVAGRLDDERRMREVLAAVRRLPRAEREAVALCLWSGVSYSEAAAVLGVAESTVRSRVSRARARLSRQLATDPDPPPPIARPQPVGAAVPVRPNDPGPPGATASPAAGRSPKVTAATAHLQEES
ncbi:RNA polymerase sigma factor [Actinoplanes hulinensis]|uniref:RNA polymerase sigma factor n=1 Tax=Actinoplanes hulinensis TaxID=1144547 RepID=A0ABS7BFP0_9ACTN|nr:RNA polymerase sigma factor [Actinoplanes hulinensis]MBW6439707.1 RNA polymerase sigma factor [Actinoplanes hulinensis]